jgi:hypothetical protein
VGSELPGGSNRRRPPEPEATPAPRRKEKLFQPTTRIESSDKYYAVPKPLRQAGLPRVAAVKPVKLVKPSPRAKPVTVPDDLLIDEPQDIAPTLDLAIQKLRNTDEPVEVHVARVPRLLITTRTKLDSMTTRSVLTEDEAAMIKLKYQEPAAKPPVAPPVPTREIVVEDDTQIDPEAFLAGQLPELEDPVIDTRASTAVEAEVTEESTGPEDDDDEDDFVLKA